VVVAVVYYEILERVIIRNNQVRVQLYEKQLSYTTYPSTSPKPRSLYNLHSLNNTSSITHAVMEGTSDPQPPQTTRKKERKKERRKKERRRK